MRKGRLYLAISYRRSRFALRLKLKEHQETELFVPIPESFAR
jgi:hypothetical protein